MRLYLFSYPSTVAEERLSTSEEVNERVTELDKSFTKYKGTVKDCLKRRTPVKNIVDTLTSADTDEYQKAFLEAKVDKLCQAVEHNDHNRLFVTMNFNWNYLDPSLLDLLVREFDLEEVIVQMDAYQSDLKRFRVQTPLTPFCQVCRRKRLRSSPDFQAAVAEFEWPDDVTLEVVEQFRQEHASHYDLRECAMVLYSSEDLHCLMFDYSKDPSIAFGILPKCQICCQRAFGTCIHGFSHSLSQQKGVTTSSYTFCTPHSVLE